MTKNTLYVTNTNHDILTIYIWQKTHLINEPYILKDIDMTKFTPFVSDKYLQRALKIQYSSDLWQKTHLRWQKYDLSFTSIYDKNYTH